MKETILFREVSDVMQRTQEKNPFNIMNNINIVNQHHLSVVSSHIKIAGRMFFNKSKIEIAIYHSY